MTPEDILRDLRDIHLPDQAVETAVVGLVWWPAALILILILLVGHVALRRHSAWRRKVVHRLNDIERKASTGHLLEGWIDLAILLRRVAIHLGGRQDVGRLTGDAWLQQLDHLFQTDVFSHGPGRGLAVFPYSQDIGDDADRRHAAGELRATIESVRLRLHHLRQKR